MMHLDEVMTEKKMTTDFTETTDGKKIQILYP
jgi:hypothetical protein